MQRGSISYQIDPPSNTSPTTPPLTPPLAEFCVHVSLADPKDDAKDVRPLGVQILSFSGNFWQKMCKIIG